MNNVKVGDRYRITQAYLDYYRRIKPNYVVILHVGDIITIDSVYTNGYSARGNKGGGVFPTDECLSYMERVND